MLLQHRLVKTLQRVSKLSCIAYPDRVSHSFVWRGGREQNFQHQVYKQSEEVGGFKILPQIVLRQQVLSYVFVLPTLLNFQQHIIQIFVLHGVVRFELLPAQPVFGMEPEAHRFAVNVDHATHVPAQQVQVLHVLVNIALLLHNTIAVLLGEDMLDSSGGIDESHHQLHVTAHSCRIYHWLALFRQVGQEVIEIFALINVEQALVLLEPQVEVFLSARSHQISLFVGCEGEGEDFVHFEDNCKFGGVFGRREKFGFVLVGLEDGLRQISLIFWFLHDGLRLGGRLFIEIKQTSCQVNNKSFFNHNLIIQTIHRTGNPSFRLPLLPSSPFTHLHTKQTPCSIICRMQYEGGHIGCEKSINDDSHWLAFLRLHFKKDEGFALVRVFLKHDVLSRAVDPRLSGTSHCTVVHLRVVETYCHAFLSSVSGSSKALEIKLDLQIVRSLVEHLRVDDMKDVLEVTNAGPIILAFYFIKSSIAPITLAAGVDLSIPAGDDEVGVLKSHLIEVMIEEIVDEGFMVGQLVDAFADGDVIGGSGGEDGGDELDFALDLVFSNFQLKIADFRLFLQYEINNGRLPILLYLFLNYWRCLLKPQRDSQILTQVLLSSTLPPACFLTPLTDTHCSPAPVYCSIQVAQLDALYIAVQHSPSELCVGGEEDDHMSKVLGAPAEIDIIPVENEPLVFFEVQRYQFFHKLILYGYLLKSYTYRPDQAYSGSPLLFLLDVTLLKPTYCIIKQKDRFQASNYPPILQKQRKIIIPLNSLFIHHYEN